MLLSKNPDGSAVGITVRSPRSPFVFIISVGTRTYTHGCRRGKRPHD